MAEIIDPNIYPRNSKTVPVPDKATQNDSETKEIKKVVNGTVTKKKKTLGQKISETFVEEDVTNVGQYILFDVIIPKAKDILSDIITGAVDMLLYGEISPNRRKSQSNRQPVNYVNYYGGNSRLNTQTRTRNSISVDSFLFESRQDAEEILSQMNDIVDRYGSVSVADFYQMIGQIGEYTDNKFGWENLSTARIRRVNGGFVIELPRVICID